MRRVKVLSVSGIGEISLPGLLESRIASSEGSSEYLKFSFCSKSPSLSSRSPPDS